jgi:very-long-chain enoyl-CoA reductase
MQVNIGLGIFILSELGNLYTHVLLSNLRPASGSKQRPIPKGFGFDLVSCPNYTFEGNPFIYPFYVIIIHF